jgi:hypothetical protein
MSRVSWAWLFALARLPVDRALHDVFLLLALLVLDVHDGVMPSLSASSRHQVVVAGFAQPLDLVDRRVVAQDDVRGAHRIRRPGICRFSQRAGCSTSCTSFGMIRGPS